MPNWQSEIGKWAEEAFGPIHDRARVAARANEEMAELLRAATSGAPIEKIAEECADIVIILARIAHAGGFDLLQEVQRKMAVNRTRTWTQDGTGHGYHERSRHG